MTQKEGADINNLLGLCRLAGSAHEPCGLRSLRLALALESPTASQPADDTTS